MSVIVQQPPQPRWVKIDLGDGASVELELTPPTYRELVEEMIQTVPGLAIADRLRSVTDWRGVSDGRQPVPFSLDGLARLLRDYPDGMHALLRELRPLFTPATRDSRKNSPEPLPAETSATPA